MKLTKIVATLGPSSETLSTIEQLLTAGVNVIRINFSHANHVHLQALLEHIRQVSRLLDKPVAILGDLQGPKIRIGELENHQPVFLKESSQVLFSSQPLPGNASHITTPISQLLEELSSDDEILLDDGSIVLRVTERVAPDTVSCQVVIGGELKEKKGINVPGLKIRSLSAMTEKDKADALFALENDFDYLALSFVRTQDDITVLKSYIEEHLQPGQFAPLIVAKIEKPQALDDLDNIIAATDALMVARGDLGVELRPEKVPSIQKMIIQKANKAEKPVITATQMLESMIEHAKPTRAEVSDVANAVFDGTDALMLSAETAAGNYPVEAASYMNRIIEEAESHYLEWQHSEALNLISSDITDEHALAFHQAIAQAACFAAQKAKTKAIVVLSYSGSMAKRISKRKPQVPIIALTPHQKVYRLLSLLWGVYPIKIAASETAEEALIEAEKAMSRFPLLQPNDPIVFCAGQTHLNGLTNTIKIYRYGEILQHYPALETLMTASC